MILNRFSAGLSTALVPMLAAVASASQWTITSYIVELPTTTTYTAGSYTYTNVYTYNYALQDGVKPTATSAALSSITSTDIYDDLKIVEVYLDGNQIPKSDIRTGYKSYEAGVYTDWVQEVVWTAPASCPTPFTVTTATNVNDVPYQVLEQRTDASLSTLVSTMADGDLYTQVLAYFPTDAFPAATTATTEDFYYSNYVKSCINPTATGSDRYPGSSTHSSSGNNYNDSNNLDKWWGCGIGCSYLETYAIVLAAVLPAIFLLGFIESYIWFRRMMVGKFSLRFGTVCWIFLLFPVLCFTRQCPARDEAAQKTLHEQWKKVDFWKAIGLWFRWGFRHRYPVELLGVHPQYSNAEPNLVLPGAPGAPVSQVPFNGAPPPAGYIYYAPGPPGPDGRPTFQPVLIPGNQLPEGFQVVTQPQTAVAPGGVTAPPPGTVMYYPQQPQQAYVPPQQPPQQASPVSPPPMVPSPVSLPPETRQAPSDISEEPHVPGPEASNPTHHQPSGSLAPGEQRGESSRAQEERSNDLPGQAK